MAYAACAILSIRHAVSKFAHYHFISNEDAKANLIQLGENPENIYIIGSPDIDVMASSTLPSLDLVRQRYDIPFTDYAILMYHPVTTELEHIYDHIKSITDAVKKQGGNYVIIYPNNDSGSDIILSRLNTLQGLSNFRILNSMRFEYFLTLLKNANFLIGNSSAGIHEAGFYGIPVIDLGTRQKGRYNIKNFENIQWIPEETDAILKAISNASFLLLSSTL